MARLLDFNTMLGPLSASVLAFTAIALAARLYVLLLRSRRQVAGSGGRKMVEDVLLELPAGVLVVVLDHAGKIQFASRKALAALGLPASDLWRGKAFAGLSCWDEPADARHTLARAVLKAEMGKPQQLALTFGPPNAPLNFLFEMNPHLDSRRGAASVVITALEVSSLLMAVPAEFNPERARSAKESSLVNAASRSADAKQLAPVPHDAKRVVEREQASASKTLVDTMFKLLPTAKALDEALKIVASYLARLFPETSGTLFMPKKGASGLHNARAWGSMASKMVRISADDCWSMRHSDLHWVEDPAVDLRCSHHESGKSACLPLVVRGELVGVLALAWSTSAPERSLLESIAEPLASALAQTVTNSALREQATKDALTGLLNRQALETEFSRLIHRAQEDSEPASVLMIDIDHFKAFNDRFGHDAGDHVLKSVATRINQAVRARDLAFRFGGEEIVVLLPGCGSEEAIHSAERMQKGLAELTLVNRGERLPSVTISVGVATFPTDGVTVESLFQAADAGVYAAKAAGRNTVIHHQPSAVRAA